MDTSCRTDQGTLLGGSRALAAVPCIADVGTSFPSGELPWLRHLARGNLAGGTSAGPWEGRERDFNQVRVGGIVIFASGRGC